MVKFMIESMAKCGCPIEDPTKYFAVRHCDENVGGGFDPAAADSQEPSGGVVLCQNHIRDYVHAGHFRVAAERYHLNYILFSNMPNDRAYAYPRVDTCL